MNNNILLEIRRNLQQMADPEIQKGQFHYFKEEIHNYGVKNPTVFKLAGEYFKAVKDSGKDNIFELCAELFKSGYMEESFIACEWSYRLRREFVPEDFKIFENWIEKYFNNWATCDTFCNHTTGSFIEMYPQYLSGLKKWATSKNRWLRRGAAVTLVIPAGSGKFLTDIFEIAGILLIDKDDLVQKGYGWMLKSASKQHLQEVFDYVMRNKKVMPRTALRYTIEKMPEDMKRQAMSK